LSDVNERRLEPFIAHNLWLLGGIIASLTLMSTMRWLHLVVGFNACDVHDALATDTYPLSGSFSSRNQALKFFAFIGK